MQPSQISYEQMIFYVTMINIVLGFLFGTFPLIAGFIMNNRKYGVYGFVGSIIGGAILGVFLSYPIAAVFTWMILKKPTAGDNADAVKASENSFEAEAANIENR